MPKSSTREALRVTPSFQQLLAQGSSTSCFAAALSGKLYELLAPHSVGISLAHRCRRALRSITLSFQQYLAKGSSTNYLLREAPRVTACQRFRSTLKLRRCALREALRVILLCVLLKSSTRYLLYEVLTLKLPAITC
eukprot:1420880-Pyramimonas_sp.AAC.1